MQSQQVSKRITVRSILIIFSTNNTHPNDSIFIVFYCFIVLFEITFSTAELW